MPQWVGRVRMLTVVTWCVCVRACMYGSSYPLPVLFDIELVVLQKLEWLQ